MTQTLTLPLPPGGKRAEIVLREPLLKHVLIADKLLETDLSLHQQRARNICLIALVSDMDEVEIRTLPVSLQNRAGAFLDQFDNPDSTEPPLDQDLLIDFPPITAPNGQIYTQILLTEPTTGAMEDAERMLRRGSNPYSLRCFGHVLINKCGDLPATVTPMLPVSVANRAGRYLSRFRLAGIPSGEPSPLT